MIGAVEATNVIGWILTVLGAGVAAGIGGYMGKRGERRAIKETLDNIEGRAADLTEAARIRWSKRSEVFAILYGRLIMAKLDGTAKGGVVVTVNNRLKVPVKFVGLGETVEDWAEFSPERFVEALFS